MSRPTIFLFDIDDTLVSTAGAGRRALHAAFCDLLGERDWLPFSLAGMTDRSIVRCALRDAGRADDAASIDRVLGRYLERLVDEVARAEGYAVFPGVLPVLDALARLPGRCAVGLGTGNLEAGAKIKLARGGLDGRFAFGGFGSDHEVRAEILRAGARRGALRLGEPVERCRVVAIGDTPRDVEAALAIGAGCVGVGTGAHSPDELRAAGAFAAFADLTAPGALAALLGEV
jgi:phosphoglycolate phosphatase-like HAD superfamily hydrolase